MGESHFLLPSPKKPFLELETNCMNCLVKFLIGRRVYLDVMIGVSIALSLAALLPASAQTTAVPAAHTPARLPAWALSPFKRFADINPIITPRPASVFSCPCVGATSIAICYTLSTPQR